MLIPPKAKLPQRGSALVVVLWVIGLLSLLVSSLAFEMHLEAIVTSYCRKRLKSDYLARSGIEMVKIIEEKSKKIKGSVESDAEEADNPWYEVARAFKNNGSVHTEQPLGEGKILLDIVPEPARRNVNKLDEKDWEGLLMVGNVPEEKWDELIDSFFDWIDSETPEDARPFGAETDYYSQLQPPYKAKNGPLETIDELLRIKGFTNTVVYGGVPAGADEDTEPMTGIADLLTTYGDDGKVNVNAASKRILMTLPDIEDITADDIIAEREGLTDTGKMDEDNHFKDLNDFFRRFPDIPRAELEKKISTSSAIYRITSVGYVQGVTKTISCIVKFENSKMTVLRWIEQEGSG